MTAYIIAFFKDPFIAGALGLLMHFLLDMYRIKREEGRLLTLNQYWIEFPIQSTICLIGFILGLVALDSYGELTTANAIGVGYLSNSVADKIGKRTGRVFE